MVSIHLFTNTVYNFALPYCTAMERHWIRYAATLSFFVWYINFLSKYMNAQEMIVVNTIDGVWNGIHAI